MDTEKITDPIAFCNGESVISKDTCFKGVATYNQDISLCSNIDETSEKKTRV